MKGFIFCLILLVLLGAVVAQEPIIIDHNCIDLEAVPMYWIGQVQTNAKMHYAHTSHGGQLTGGLGLIEDDDASYAFDDGYCSLPSTPGAFCIFDGQEWGDYISPEDYWETRDGMNYTRAVLDNNPDINYSMFCWCGQMSYYSSDQVYAYFDSMETLQAEYPEVTFIFMTGHAQYDGWDGWTRRNNNDIIRDYVQTNNQILFDFADIDCHYLGELYTYDYEGEDIPLEHPHYAGEDMAHTNYENCRHKGNAFWWMMARLEGWPGIASVTHEGDRFPDRPALTVCPNPFNGSVKIEASNRIAIYDASGRHVDSIEPGIWQPSGLPTGVYTAVVTSDGQRETLRLLYVK